MMYVIIDAVRMLKKNMLAVKYNFVISLFIATFSLSVFGGRVGDNFVTIN